MRAARFMGVAPWDLVERADGWLWTRWALMAEGAEVEAQEALAKHKQKR